jgi:hypothetical protein
MGHEIPIPALTILRQFLRNRLETAWIMLVSWLCW